MLKLNLDDTFTRNLPADPISENYRRQVPGACYSYVNPKPVSEAALIAWSEEVSSLLGIQIQGDHAEEWLEILSGNKNVSGFKPYAQCYGGHQFGHWAGQLGDGRAINIAEIKTESSNYILQLKGAGPTPYSRSADGLAVLRSSIREFLCSEAMYHLGIPTTRALSLVSSGEEVMRDMLYDGNSKPEPGAIVCRVAPTFIRFGNFQLFLARKDHKNLQVLMDYTLNQFYPECGQAGKAAYLNMFKAICERTLDMIIHWQRVGFVHGVMNTDNMSILGQTIDYGPYGWLEGYDHGWTPNTTDRQHKRYRYGQQASIGLWNLAQLASAFHPIIDDQEALQAILDAYQSDFHQKYTLMMAQKLGLHSNTEQIKSIISTLLETLHLAETDMTIFFRALSEVQFDDSAASALSKIHQAFYQPEDITGLVLQKWTQWFESYIELLPNESTAIAQRMSTMQHSNPKYVLRNYMAQLAIEEAEKGNYTLIESFMDMLKQPYTEQPKYDKWYAKRPEWARHKVGCSMLSCSS